jgi:RecB family exonuclease
VTGFLAGGKPNDALAFVKGTGRDHSRLAQGLHARQKIQLFDHPAEYDGIIGARPDAVLFKGGKVSATALENFGRCAFKYFGENILELRPLEEYEMEESLEAKHKGTAAHYFLEEFYKQLTQDGKKPLPKDLPSDLFDTVFASTIDRIPAEELKLHPVVWEASKITLKEKLLRYVEADLRFCQETGFQPILIEKEFVGPLPEFGNKTVWKGRIDRIDKGPTGYSVIDYKTGRYTEKKSAALDAIRGQKLQAPLYILMARELFQEKKMGKPVDFRYVYPMEEADASQTFSAENWLEYGPTVLKTVTSQLEWARQGHFVMVPEDAQCKWCEIAQICRKSHGISVYRSRQGEGEKFWKLRAAK